MHLYINKYQITHKGKKKYRFSKTPTSLNSGVVLHNDCVQQTYTLNSTVKPLPTSYTIEEVLCQHREISVVFHRRRQWVTFNRSVCILNIKTITLTAPSLYQGWRDITHCWMFRFSAGFPMAGGQGDVEVGDTSI